MPPEAAYLPPNTAFTLAAGPGRGSATWALCFAPARTGTAARLLPGDRITPETRGSGATERLVRPILMGQHEDEAESLLVTEVQTPAGNWSSYPPHKHDRDALPDESYLEETYYHRIDPPQGFGLQRIYTDDRSLDETLASATASRAGATRLPPGRGAARLPTLLPQRDGRPEARWAFHNDPDHAWRWRPRRRRAEQTPGDPR